MDVAYWNFGFTLLNAVVITKVIMIGEYAKLEGRTHGNPRGSQVSTGGFTTDAGNLLNAPQRPSQPS